MDIVIYCFHTAANEIRFVPESRSPGVAQKLLPPQTVRLRSRPTLQIFETPPVLAHSRMHGKNGIDDRLMKQKAFRFSRDRFRYLGTKTNGRFESKEKIDAHPQINHDQIGVPSQVYCPALYLHFSHLHHRQRNARSLVYRHRKVLFLSTIRGARFRGSIRPQRGLASCRVYPEGWQAKNQRQNSVLAR